MTQHKAGACFFFFFLLLLVTPRSAFSELTCEDLPDCSTATDCTDSACPACYPDAFPYCTTCCGLDQIDCEIIEYGSGLGPCFWNGSACDDSNNPCNLIPETPKPVRKFLPLVLGAFFLALLGGLMLLRKKANPS